MYFNQIQPSIYPGPTADTMEGYGGLRWEGSFTYQLRKHGTGHIETESTAKKCHDLERLTLRSKGWQNIEEP